LRRVPGLLDGARDRRRRGQGPRAQWARPGGEGARDRRGRRALPLLHRRLGALHGARDLDGGPGRARLGHRAGLRRVHPVPRHALGSGDIDGLLRGVELGMDTFDCAMPTRLGRHGVAIVPDPEGRWRVDLTAARWARSQEPIMEGCPCPACALGYTRGYLRYLLRARELTALRALTIHNL